MTENLRDWERMIDVESGIIAAPGKVARCRLLAGKSAPLNVH